MLRCLDEFKRRQRSAVVVYSVVGRIYSGQPVLEPIRADEYTRDNR